MRGLWAAVRDLDNVVAATTQTRVLLEGRKLVERATRWLLRHRRAPLDVTATVDRLGAGAHVVAGLLPGVLSADAQAVHVGVAGSLGELGVPAPLAERTAGFDELFSALDIVEVATSGDHPVEDVAATYFALEERLELRWLRGAVNGLPRDNRWQTLARLALRDDLYGQLREITAAVLTFDDVETWFDRKATAVARCKQVMADIRAAGTFDLATLSVGLRETHALVAT